MPRPGPNPLASSSVPEACSSCQGDNDRAADNPGCNCNHQWPRNTRGHSRPRPTVQGVDLPDPRSGRQVSHPMGPGSSPRTAPPSWVTRPRDGENVSPSAAENAGLKSKPRKKKIWSYILSSLFNSTASFKTMTSFFP